MANEIAVPQFGFSLSPRNISEAIEFAEMMAKSELVPKQFRGRPADVLVAVQMGAEIGLAPMASIQNIAVINGKPGIFGDAGKAVLLAAGCVIDEDDGAVVNKNGYARCKITRPGRPPVERTFSCEDAKLAGLWGKEGPWRSYPYRQLAWRAFWFAARDAAADLLKGLGGAEEIADIKTRDMGEAQVVERAAPPRVEAPKLPDYTAEAFAQNYPTWVDLVDAGKTTPERLLALLRGKATVSDKQAAAILKIGKSSAESGSAGSEAKQESAQ